MKLSLCVLGVLLCCLALPLPAVADTICYVDADFEGGATDLEGGTHENGGNGSLTNVAGSNLDGRAIELEATNISAATSGIGWDRGALADSTTHHVSLDFWFGTNGDGETNGQMNVFLDAPSILKVVVTAAYAGAGRHSLDVYYDFDAEEMWVYLNGTLDNSLIDAQVWGSKVSDGIRIFNSQGGPKDDWTLLQVDNVTWKGNVEIPAVPEPGTLALFALGGLGLAVHRRRRARAA